MFSWIVWLLNIVKHMLMDLVHTSPWRVIVYGGKAGSMERAILEEVVSSTNMDYLEMMPDDTDFAPEVRPFLTLNDELTVTSGRTAICRYLGRLWRSYPTTPSSALKVDASLETLEEFVRPWVTGEGPEYPEAHLRRFIEKVEQTLNPNYPYNIYNFESPTLADQCWAGAFRFVVSKELEEDPSEDFPLFKYWWQANVGEDVAFLTCETGDTEKSKED